MKRNKFEEQMQKALIQWAQYHPIASVYLTSFDYGGVKSIGTAIKAKQMGLKSGMPDLFLFYRSKQGESGLWLELKVKPNKPSKNQLEMMDKLKEQGYRCEIIYDDWELGAHAIEEYLS